MTATLNIRLPKELKQHGQQVLDREQVSTSDLIRSLYQYMEEHQEIPSFAKNSASATEEKRRSLQSMAGRIAISEDAEAQWREHLGQKYGDS